MRQAKHFGGNIIYLFGGALQYDSSNGILYIRYLADTTSIAIGTFAHSYLYYYI